VGMATFIRETGLKERHKGRIYGVYVTAAFRRQGVARALLSAILHEVKKDSSLEQVPARCCDKSACREAAVPGLRF
jgi:GNAT superfamily N-acetyltransferase